MGSSTRGVKESSTKNPGPGSYQLSQRLGEAPKYGMRPRTAIVLKNGIPGPGQYNPSPVSVKLRPPSAVMGHGLRSGETQTTRGMPGPGAYLSQQAKKAGPSFSFGLSKNANKTKQGPGPGAYNVPSTFASLPPYVFPGKASEYEKI